MLDHRVIGDFQTGKIIVPIFVAQFIHISCPLINSFLLSTLLTNPAGKALGSDWTINSLK